jgi:hypothetical protein
MRIFILGFIFLVAVLMYGYWAMIILDSIESAARTYAESVFPEFDQ